jgi:hypothetical protein
VNSRSPAKSAKNRFHPDPITSDYEAEAGSLRQLCLCREHVILLGLF